jgi:septal ring factor EnvC (AmiA/AmiB activator)
MFNKKLQKKLRHLERCLAEIYNEPAKLKRNIKESEERMKGVEDKVKRIEIRNDERWKMLKKYLNVEEEEYAELKDDYEKIYCMSLTDLANDLADVKKKAVKKTRLVKKKKK